VGVYADPITHASSAARPKLSSLRGDDAHHPVTPRKLYNFYIDPELAKGLNELKARTGAPESESIRRALTDYRGVVKKTDASAPKRPAAVAVDCAASRAGDKAGAAELT
jgi:hypothetical protein